MAIKFVFFDMEGTIFRKAVKVTEKKTAPSAWTFIAKNLGEAALAEEVCNYSIFQEEGKEDFREILKYI